MWPNLIKSNLKFIQTLFFNVPYIDQNFAFSSFFKYNMHILLFFAVPVPKQLEFVEFSRHYEAPPPAPDSERTPEVIEAEIKALEAAMEQLILVTLK